MRVKETLEHIDENGNVVKKMRPKYLGFIPGENGFQIAMEKMWDKIYWESLRYMNLAEKTLDEPRKKVFTVKMVLKFVYDQRWTYELVDD